VLLIVKIVFLFGLQNNSKFQFTKIANSFKLHLQIPYNNPKQFDFKLGKKRNFS